MDGIRIRKIFRLMALAFYRWARKELSAHQPLHPDLPMVVRKVAELEAVCAM